ncbi:MAG: ATP-binding protein [Myxococcota bacterium]
MKASVLVVEDNEALAENVAELFEEAGAEVTITDSAGAALEKARAREHDLAVVDLRLHGQQDGLSLVPDLKEASPLGEIILVTGNASLDTAIAAVRHGVYAYVLKPFDPEDLLALGERALAQVSLRREREGLARELAASEALYRGVVDTVEALIVGIDTGGQITFCNRHACTVVGLEPEEVQAQAFENLFADEHAHAMRRYLSCATQGDVIRDRDVPLRAGTGGERVVRWTLTPLHDSGAAKETVLAVGLDVTERLELERRSAENAAMAAMGQLTTGLAHEIRNPLNAAKLQLELLERAAGKVADAEAGERIRNRAGVVREEIDSLSRMLEEFLSLARPRGMKLEPMDLEALVNELVELHGPLAEEEGVTLEGRVVPSLGPVRADREKIKQALVNLVANAVDAMREQREGRVRIGARPVDDEWVEVTVRDTGPGISEEVAERLFQPFVTTKPAGTGLGLSIVQRTVELHGGTVALAPAEGGGTLARLTLPRARERVGNGQ